MSCSIEGRWPRLGYWRNRILLCVSVTYPFSFEYPISQLSRLIQKPIRVQKEIENQHRYEQEYKTNHKTNRNRMIQSVFWELVDSHLYHMCVPNLVTPLDWKKKQTNKQQKKLLHYESTVCWHRVRLCTVWTVFKIFLFLSDRMEDIGTEPTSWLIDRNCL